MPRNQEVLQPHRLIENLTDLLQQPEQGFFPQQGRTVESIASLGHEFAAPNVDIPTIPSTPHATGIDLTADAQNRSEARRLENKKN